MYIYTCVYIYTHTSVHAASWHSHRYRSAKVRTVHSLQNENRSVSVNAPTSEPTSLRATWIWWTSVRASWANSDSLLEHLQVRSSPETANNQSRSGQRSAQPLQGRTWISMIAICRALCAWPKVTPLKSLLETSHGPPSMASDSKAQVPEQGPRDFRYTSTSRVHGSGQRELQVWRFREGSLLEGPYV